MSRFFKKIYLIFIPLALLFATVSHKMVLDKENMSVLGTMNGKIIYANSPENYYRATVIKEYDPEPLWMPNELFGTSTQPSISGESGLLVDMDTGKILFEKDSNRQMKIASLTKIMTAVVALEHKSLDTKIYVTRHAAYVGENTMYLTTGEVYTLRELLYGLILNSANDAAYAIADGVAGDSDTFVKWMNIKAKELGLNDTTFYDPSGLDDRNTSSVSDLVRLARYSMKSPDFREAAKTIKIELNSDTHKYVYLENQTNLLTTYPGVEGIKTGFTEEAGLCLVTYASNGGHQVIGAVLKSQDRKGDMILMLNHGFATLGINIDYPLY